MAIYALGDIQGCYDPLQQLLEQLKFDPAKDQLWFVGDLVNRGPNSLDTLRLVKSLGNSAVTVLGNHDLHLLALAHGNDRHFKPGSGLEEILDAKDGGELIDWLRHQPLLHHDEKRDLTMIHAGLPPQWSLKRACKCAAELERTLRSKHYSDFLAQMYGNEPDTWSDDLKGMDRLRFITNALTRLRFLDMDGALKMKEKGSPHDDHKGVLPWYAHPQRKTRKNTILFGHWSTLGYYHGHNVYALDSGCLWGGTLTALRVDRQPYQITELACPQAKKPG